MLTSQSTPAELAAHVDSLLEKMTDDEALSLLHSLQRPIERLGLGEFRTGGEAVHGVAWLGQATVFPQPPGLAAMWDEDLLRRIGEATGREVRAKHQAGEAHLNCWAPVVNPLRNPLWGRNEEGFSEDPWVTSTCATAFSQGLKGDHPTYWRTLPTLKHLLGYNNETDRCTSSSDLTPRDLHEYELPAFLGPLAGQAIAGVMPAYNLVNGRPVHIAAELLDELRAAAPDLIAVSDAYAVMNLHQAERAVPDMATGHAAAVRAGLDSFTEMEADPEPTIAALREALARDLLTMDEVRTAARRLLLARARTGEFTQSGGPFADDAALDTAEHAALAHEAAAAQVTLLTNNGALPLRPDARLTVVGPMADQVLLDWYSGTPSNPISLAQAAGELGATSDDGADHVRLSTPDGRGVRLASDAVVLAEHDQASVFEVTRWHDDVVTIRDPDSGLLWNGRDWFAISASSARAHGWVCHEAFRWVPDGPDAVRLQHRGTRMWVRSEPFSGVLSMTADAFERATSFTIEMVSDGAKRIRALASDSDIAIIALGNEPHLHGRETEDRTTLALPWRQTELAEAAQAAPTTVGCVISSYPFAVPDLADTVDALVWSSHAGQALGPALLEVLTGAREPRGRLAQTWWASDDDLADVLDYRLLDSRQTYWYSTAKPLFALGHGLGYGQVVHDRLELRGSVAEDTLEAVVSVHNPSDRTRAELVQVQADGGPDWGLRLVGWQRIDVEPGQSTEVAVRLPTERLRQWCVRRNGWGWPDQGWTITTGSSMVDRQHPILLPSPEQDDSVRDHPLIAWHADQREGLVGVPVDLLRGTALAARPEGTVHFTRVAAADGLVAVVRNPSTKPGRLVVQTSSGASTEVTVVTSSDWHEVTIALEVQQADDLSVRLEGVELDRLDRA